DDWLCNSMLLPYPCEPHTFNTLTQLTIPDGRSYTFKYGPWGNLIYSATPDGSVTVYGYTDGSQTVFAPPGWGANTWNAPTQTRILRSKTVYPRGMSGPGYTTTITHESIQTFANASSFERCGIIQWFRITNPDGSYQRHAICASTFWAPQLGPTLDSELFAEE